MAGQSASFKGAGCRIVADWGGAFYVRGSFGNVFDVIEE
jgi:hypothetical protein